MEVADARRRERLSFDLPAVMVLEAVQVEARPQPWTQRMREASQPGQGQRQLDAPSPVEVVGRVERALHVDRRARPRIEAQVHPLPTREEESVEENVVRRDLELVVVAAI